MQYSTSFLFAALASLAAAQNPFTFTTLDTVAAGSPFNITWAPSTGTTDTVSLILRQGNANALGTVQTIAAGIQNTGSYLWTPSASLVNGPDYAFEIVDDGNTNIVNYSNQFAISSSNTATPSSSAASSTSASASSTSGSTSASTTTESTTATTTSSSGSSTTTETSTGSTTSTSSGTSSSATAKTTSTSSKSSTSSSTGTSSSAAATASSINSASSMKVGGGMLAIVGAVMAAL